MPHIGSRTFILVMLATCCLPVHGADAGYAAKATELLERPAAQAKAVVQLARRQPVQILGRDGSWAKAQAGTATGWVRIADIRLNTVTAKTPAPVRANGAKKDTGIRGFSEEELLVGAPNQAESERLKRVGVSVRDAVAFARAGNLRARQQDYIEMSEYMPEGGFPPNFFDE
jgi:SH3 domain-containing protein